MTEVSTYAYHFFQFFPRMAILIPRTQRSKIDHFIHHFTSCRCSWSRTLVARALVPCSTLLMPSMFSCAFDGNDEVWNTHAQAVSVPHPTPPQHEKTRPNEECPQRPAHRWTHGKHTSDYMVTRQYILSHAATLSFEPEGYGRTRVCMSNELQRKTSFPSRWVSTPGSYGINSRASSVSYLLVLIVPEALHHAGLVFDLVVDLFSPFRPYGDKALTRYHLVCDHTAKGA